MGMIFKKLESYITHVPVGSVFVEIGSDRYEGSTAELDRLAGVYQSKLITVDMLPEAQNRLSGQLTNTEFVIDDGKQWAINYQGPPIACLYLDNFDYNWDINENSNMYIHKQIADYAERGVQMTNQNCQIEHLAQMIYLYTHLLPDAVVMFDDTYLYNDCWIGKCGPAVVYLQALGWKILNHTTDSGCGIILKRS
jgi:hypothetical protein